MDRLAVAKGHHGSGLQEIVDSARAAGIPVRFEGRSQLDRWSGGGTHQGVVAWTAALAYRDADEVLQRLTHPAFVLVLDGVQDPRNLGALLRTAVAAGVQAVFLPERGAAGLTGTVVKASAGLAAQIPVARVKNLARFLETLKKEGLWVVGVQAEGAPVWQAFDLKMPLALVLGGEGGGLRPLLRQKCDVQIGLPMAPGVESLNVSVAFGIVAYEVLRQRGVKF